MSPSRRSGRLLGTKGAGKLFRLPIKLAMNPNFTLSFVHFGINYRTIHMTPQSKTLSVAIQSFSIMQ